MLVEMKHTNGFFYKYFEKDFMITEHNTLVLKLETLHRAIEAYTKKGLFTSVPGYEDDLTNALRAQVIQAFEYSTDHFWK